MGQGGLTQQMPPKSLGVSTYSSKTIPGQGLNPELRAARGQGEEGSVGCSVAARDGGGSFQPATDLIGAFFWEWEGIVRRGAEGSGWGR